MSDEKASAPLKPIYKDDFISADETGLTIFWYYFPIASSKIIKWDQIKEVTVKKMGLFTGSGRAWGSTFDKDWMHCDFSRILGGKSHKLTMTLKDARTKVSITPDKTDFGTVWDLIRANAPQDAVFHDQELCAAVSSAESMKSK